MKLEDVFAVAPYDWISIASCLICGVIVGLERQLRGKPAGIRTSSLIVLGTYIFITTSVQVSTDMSDPSRIIGQIVTGIGFLGAGVMFAKGDIVVGVTSAATIWALASLGICVAVVSPFVAIKLSVIIVGILYGVDLLEDYSSRFTRGVHKKIHRLRNKQN